MPGRQSASYKSRLLGKHSAPRWASGANTGPIIPSRLLPRLHALGNPPGAPPCFPLTCPSRKPAVSEAATVHRCGGHESLSAHTLRPVLASWTTEPAALARPWTISRSPALVPHRTARSFDSAADQKGACTVRVQAPCLYGARACWRAASLIMGPHGV